MTRGGISHRRVPRLMRSVLLVLAVALPLAALLALTRTDDLPLPAGLERLLDTRSESQRAIDQAQRRLASAPDDARGMGSLALAHLQRVRETGDPASYAQAEALVRRALTLAPDDHTVVVAAGSLALGQHDFAQALEHGRRAVALAPFTAAGHGILADALIELGRYEDAIAAVQAMVDLRPDLASYSRVAYVRELHGDIAGATSAMRQALRAGDTPTESAAWTEVQLGHLLFLAGDLDGAEQAYGNSRLRVKDYVYGQAGLARVKAARGDLAGAAELYERAVERLPIPELAAALGDVYTKLGDRARAEQQYAVVEAGWALLAASGVRTDIDEALFKADHERDSTAALAAVRTEYEARKSVHVADALAWAEYRSGDVASAVRHSAEALRLGTADPLMLYRAGIIAEAAGEPSAALALFTRASERNPRYSVLFADDLADRLRRLSASSR